MDVLRESVASEFPDEKSRSRFASDVPNADLGPRFGRIRLDTDFINPDERCGEKFDFPNNAVPDGLRVLDVSVCASQIELLPVIHADDELMLAGRDSCEVEDMRCTERVLFPQLASIDPDLALPDDPLQRESDAAAFPVRRNLNRATIPSWTNKSIFTVRSCKALFADNRLHGEGHSQSRLVGGTRQLDRLLKSRFG